MSACQILHIKEEGALLLQEGWLKRRILLLLKGAHMYLTLLAMLTLWNRILIL